MTRFARTERRDLCRTLLAVGPAAPTLCEGWTARDLAAHLVVREGRPDAAPGIVLPPLAGWTRRVQRRVAGEPWEQLVNRLRRPPRWSPLQVGPVDEAVNLTEFLVHHEDVLRARPGWRPRELPADYEGALWAALRTRARALYARSSVGVVLRLPDGTRHEARGGDRSVTLTGGPVELMLHAFGRTEHAQVDVEGDPGDVSRFLGTPLGV